MSGHEVTAALLPSLLTATLGASAAVLGVIEGLADGLAGAARLAGGAVADDPVRRRASAVGGYTATAALSGLIGVAGNPVQVGLLRAGAWTARGFRVPARNALLADAVPMEVYGRAYGFERAMDNLGAVLGPLLALGLVTAVGVRAAILSSIVPGLAAAAAIVYAIGRIPWRRTVTRQPLRWRFRSVLAGPLRRLAAGIGLFELGNVAATLLILRATELLAPARGIDAATTAALGLYLVYNVAATGASLAAGRANDRRGSVAGLAVGVGLCAGAYAALAVTPASLLVLGGCFVAAGVAVGCVETAEHAAVATHAPASGRGSAFGLLAATQAFGNLAASSIAGLLWTLVSATAAFAYASGLCAVGLIALLVTQKRLCRE
jgi:MFS family permease